MKIVNVEEVYTIQISKEDAVTVMQALSNSVTQEATNPVHQRFEDDCERMRGELSSYLNQPA